MAARNLINLQQVSKSYAADPVIDGLSLGVSAGDRIGIVGRNGAGKSTLIRLMTGAEAPDSGRVTRSGGVRCGVLTQSSRTPTDATVRDCTVGTGDVHQWASDPATRALLTHLLGGFDDARLDRTIGTLSGGERRRVDLAAVLMGDLDLLVLDEPTNHLDVETVAWLADHLNAQRDRAVLLITHDRWLLDAVTTRTWEVVRGTVDQYDGGYAAYVLAKAERARQANVENKRRNSLIRKELAWLRRGPPARTSKPKFRVDVATELISRDPPPRDRVELLAFADSRLGKTVYELHDVTLRVAGRALVDRLSWNIGPGDRLGIVGVNGAGKTSLVRMLIGELRHESGRIVRGKTVKVAYLSQHLDELDPNWRVLEAVEDVAKHVRLGSGRELTASQLCERLGFDPEAQWTPVGDLSGGERRRLQLTRLLMTEPNVLILDEPTNDYDVETLTALEDLLDSFGGTLLVISHDRYFLERVCDGTVGMLGDGTVRDLPRGVEQYLELLGRRTAAESTTGAAGAAGTTTAAGSGPGVPAAAEQRRLRKAVQRAERVIERAESQEARLHERMAVVATDHAAVSELATELLAVEQRREVAEQEWLEAVEALD